MLKGHKLGNGVAACLGFIKKVLIFSVFIGLYKKAAQPAVPNRHHFSARFGFFEITGQRQVKLANAKIETDFSFSRREAIDFRMRFARRPSRFRNEGIRQGEFRAEKIDSGNEKPRAKGHSTINDGKWTSNTVAG
ncbi:MAG: hypothetical protein AAAB19_24955 [Rhizobium sp.]